MLTKKKAKKLMLDLITGHHEKSTSNHYKDAAAGIDIIYNKFYKFIFILFSSNILTLLICIYK